MNEDPANPYSAPQTRPRLDSDVDGDALNLDAITRKKVDAIIKDAGQFWLAILMCIFCSGLGMVIIGPWYAVRLLQWNAMSNRFPQLMVPGPRRGSLQQKLQSAKTKLIIGMSVGAMVFVVFGLLLLGAIFSARAAVR